MPTKKLKMGTLPKRFTFLPNFYKEIYTMNSMNFKPYEFIAAGEAIFTFEDEYEYIARDDCIILGEISDISGMQSESNIGLKYGDQIGAIKIFSVHGKYEYAMYLYLKNCIERKTEEELEDHLDKMLILETTSKAVESFCFKFAEEYKVNLPYLASVGLEKSITRDDFLQIIKIYTK